MVDNTRPSRRPASSEDSTGQFRQIMRKHTKALDDMMPAQVTAYDRATNRASVQIMLDIVMTDGTFVEREPIISVPVMQFGGGGFIFSMPINIGDLGYLKASDRDWTNFLDTYTRTQPNTHRYHSFADSVFIPDPMTGYTIADNATSVWQSLDGTTAIILDDGEITVKVNGNTIVTNADRIVATVGASLIEIEDAQITAKTATFKIEGNLEVDGNVSGTGTFDLGTGGAAIARVGDSTSDGATITTGSSNSKSI